MTSSSFLNGAPALSEVVRWGRLIKFSHTVFALPFALAMAVVVSRHTEVPLGDLFWILVALVSARTAAMAYNRLVDASIDSKNPRTVMREIPAGIVTRRSVWMLLTASSAGFFVASAALGWHCAVLAPLVLGFLFFYSWTKRFTSCAHVVLGVALALAPGGVWYALTAELSWTPVWLMAAVAAWVFGFDILYSCQDSDFDRSQGLHSVPATLGVEVAFRIAFISHLLCVSLLTMFGLVAELGIWFFAGVGVFALFLFGQYRYISPRDYSAVNQAFFTQNGWASVVLFLFVLLDRLLY